MENRKKRTSILKVRQETEITDETTVQIGGPSGTNRRVSFHAVKQVKQYDRDQGRIIDSTPVKEKAFETMSSDGGSTPHVTHVDMDITESTLSATTSRNPSNGTLDMSMETTVNENNDETARLFEMTREVDKRNTLVYEKTVETTTKVTERILTRGRVPELSDVADDTLAIFNQTNREEMDMNVTEGGESETLNMFNTTNHESVDMDITLKGKADNTMNQFRTPAPKISRNAVDMDITQGQSSTNADETIGLFRSPAPIKKRNEPIDMDISLVASSPFKTADDTIALFRTPTQINKKKKAMIQKTPEPGSEAMDISIAPFSEINERDNKESVDMDITLKSTTNVQNLIEREEEVDMDITQDRGADNTMALFQSPARVKTASVSQNPLKELFEKSMDIENESTVIPRTEFAETPENATLAEENPEEIPAEKQEDMDLDESSMINVTSTNQVEEERAVLHMSMVEMSSYGDEENEELDEMKQKESPSESPRPTSSAREASSIHNSSISLNISTRKENDESMIKTMRYGETDDETNTLQDTSPKENSEEMEEEEQEKTLQMTNYEKMVQENTERIEEDVINTTLHNTNQSRMSISSYNMTISSSIPNQSTSSIPRRRRSLLNRDQSIRESPRRVAIENSMQLSIHSSMRGEALAEYRHNKTIQNTSVGGMNDSMNSSIGGRDILKMNTSIRSPHHLNTSANDSTINSSETAPFPPPSPGFQIPDFDQAVVNIIYLTPDDSSKKPIPEAVDFQKLLENEKEKMQKEIQNSMKGSENDPDHMRKIELLRNNKISEMSKDDREVVMMARKLAEIRFLELRSKFAVEQKLKSEAKIAELTTQNSKIAQQIRDIKNISMLKKEIEEMKNRPTPAECHRIQEEYNGWRLKMMEIRLESIRFSYYKIAQFKKQKSELLNDIEQKREKLAQLEDAEKKEMAVIAEKVRGIVHC